MGQADALLKTLRKVPDQSRRHRVEPEPLDRGLHRRHGLGTRQAPRPGDEAQEAANALLRVEPGGLHHQADPGLDPRGRDRGRDSIDFHAAFTGEQEARHETDEGRLARPVCTQQSEGLPRLDRQRAAVESDAVTEAAREFARLDPHTPTGRRLRRPGFPLAQPVSPLARCSDGTSLCA